MSIHIELVDTRVAPEQTLRALHELYLTRDAELLPDDPPVPWEQRLVDWRNLLDSEEVPRWALWRGPEAVATAGVYMDREQNLENAFGWVYVHPDHRGSGHGREVASPMLDAAEKDGRIRFAFELNEGRPEEELLKRAGMKSAYREQLSRLSFPDVDWSLMELWVKKAEERAGDYELLYLPSPIEEEHLQALCDLHLVMNTAPREDYEEEDEITTPELWRDIEAKEERKSRDVLTYVARHESGEFAGYTTVVFHRLQPDLVWQWDTGVDPKHRNKGLGRWVKAAMALRLRSDYPSVRRIDTFNAGSNRPMLNINIEMGFKPVLVQNVWQGDLATLRERLSV
ncbi:MAG TPA: GNAT family N-acetyltransferase [Acidimicrobiia bacterium]